VLERIILQRSIVQQNGLTNQKRNVIETVDKKFYTANIERQDQSFSKMV
jgi:hypothetical protein